MKYYRAVLNPRKICQESPCRTLVNLQLIFKILEKVLVVFHRAFCYNNDMVIELNFRFHNMA